MSNVSKKRSKKTSVATSSVSPQEMDQFVDGSQYSPSPEEVKVDIEYAITINPSDTYQYFSSHDRIKEFTDFWQVYINTMACEIKLCLEVSKMGRLHWHGIIKFHTQKNINTFYVSNIHALSLRCMHIIKPIASKADWDVYISKSKHMFDISISTTDANIKRLSMVETITNKNKLKPHVVKHKDYFGVPEF